MQSKNILIGLILLITLVACKRDWLDVRSDKNQTIPSTLDDFELLLDNTSLNGVSVSLGEVASDDYYITEASWTTSLADASRNAYTWSHNYPNLAVVDWERSYQNVFYANVVLDGLKKVKYEGEKEQMRYNQIMGNALFVRSKAFYDLVQIYAPPYDSISAASDYGIPLRVEADINIPTKRSNLQETYNQIISDLNSAKDLLPPIPLYKTRGSRPAAYAMLAKTYLITGDYLKANQNADACLLVYDSLLDYNSLNSSWSYGAPLFNAEVIYHCNSVAYPIMTTRALLDSTIRNSLDSNDLRREIFFRKNTDGTYRFKGNYDHTTTTRLFFGIATDEIYLIRAETHVRLNNIVEGLRDLDTLLKKRWKKDKIFEPTTAADKENALVKILTERRRELLMRGVRWSDLRRLNKDARFKIILNRSIGGKSYILEPGSHKYTFPIPDDIIQITKIPQNIDWD